MKLSIALPISLVLVAFVAGPVTGQEPFVFAVIADVQYADKPAGSVRHYQTALVKLAEAVEHLNAERPVFTIQLGDLIDGRGMPGSQEDLNTVLGVFNRLEMPTYHAVGNHDLTVDRGALYVSLGLERSYYDFTVPSAEGWHFIVTDGTDAGYGVMSAEQTDWFGATLEAAAAAGEYVICFNHFALLQEAAPSHRMAAPEPILDALDEAGNVVAWIAGHDHQGGYALRNGVHHVTVCGMVEAPVDNAYALMELHSDRLREVGFGKEPSRDMPVIPAIPVVDFNGDGIVDVQDLAKLAEHWDGDAPSFDIAPLPGGDGIIDVQDLELLLGYWQQEVEDPTLVAHWRLDEVDGAVASDNAGEHAGVLVGDPIWCPAEGRINGALQFDGIDDYVRTPFVVDPARRPFSVLAWIKGGLPGQVVISQREVPWGTNWLRAAPSEGGLITELRGTGRADRPLSSGSVITDGDWHRIGLVWDRSNRVLYVDDVAVIGDTQEDLIGSNAGLHIGAARALGPGLFWSGLIDDIRIYNRAVSP
ncbi:MAG: LamG-like jellyroll fold domain-containing protein [Planctomycetota bacterium]